MVPSSLPRRQPAFSVREAEKFAERGLAALAARRGRGRGKIFPEATFAVSADI